MRKIIALILVSLLMFSVVPAVFAEDVLSDDIVILHTNDVHSYIDDPLSYDVLAGIKAELETEYKYVLLADAGDHVQGTAYGSMDKGESIIKLMNAAGYDVATPGNHEFDYGMDGFENVLALADYPYISANFYRQADGIRGERVLDSYKLFDCGEEKVAFVGITTPDTLTKSTPAYFQDGEGNYIYEISAGDVGAELHREVQLAIDEAVQDGATQVIALGHLGTDMSSSPYTSTETIGGISGLDAFIDGHSHTDIEGEVVADKDGNDVVLAQTGEHFNKIGIMIIDSETGEIKADSIECEEMLEENGETAGYSLKSELYSGTELVTDESVKTLKDAWLAEIDDKLGEVIGVADVVFDNYDSDGKRLVRVTETNSGDFSADALYYLFDDLGYDVDFAIMNGGGIRNEAITGNITYKDCKNIHPFGNVACLQIVTGQQILDALEWGVRKLGGEECGGFLQVSGIRYTVRTDFAESTVRADEFDTWIGGPTGEYRVISVEVYNKETDTWDKLDLSAKYNLAGYNYTLRDLGDGFAMFDGAVNIIDYVMEDYMVLANYVKAFKDGIIGAKNSPLLEKYPSFMLDYSSVYGSGRIDYVEIIDDSIITSNVQETTSVSALETETDMTSGDTESMIVTNPVTEAEESAVSSDVTEISVTVETAVDVSAESSVTTEKARPSDAPKTGETDVLLAVIIMSASVAAVVLSKKRAK